MKVKISPLLFLFSLIFVVTANADDNLQDLIQRAKNEVLPALVHIEPVKEIFSSGKRVKVQVTGSGVIIDPRGYVLTNNHVAEKARYVRCTLANRDEVPAEVVGLDALTDLAVLKLDLSGKDYDTVPAAGFGDSDKLEVGQVVMALGSPLGLSRSVSMGVISSLDRYFEDRGEMVSPFNLWIQTDAAINPGNSGGPLINLEGQIIGINARAITFGENLGFAIPVNTARMVVEQILKYGEVMRSWVGIEWQEIREYKRFKNQPQLEGALVAFIEKGSPAEAAQLQPGDLVYAIAGKPVTATYLEELPRIRKLIAEIPVGSQVTVEYLRGGEKQTTKLVTAERGKYEGNEFECPEWGLSVKELTPRIVQNLNLKSDKGVLVSGVQIGSMAYEGEVMRGQVIRSVDDVEVHDLEQFKEMYREAAEIPEKGRMLKLVSANVTRYALLKEK